MEMIEHFVKLSNSVMRHPFRMKNGTYEIMATENIIE